MDKIQTLRAAFETLQSEVTELDALDNPTDEQTARFALAIDEAAAAKVAYDQAVERAEKVDTIRSAALAEPKLVERGSFQAPNVNIKKDPFENLAAIRFEADEDLVGRAVTALSDTKYRSGGIPERSRERAVELVEMLPAAARYALGHASPAYMSAFRTWFNNQGQNFGFSAEQQAAYDDAQSIRAAMSLSGSAGGYSLPTLLDPTLIHTGTASKNPIRQLARVVTGTQDVWHGVSVGNVTSYWVAEGSALTEGSPTFSNPSVDAAKLTAWLTGSFEIFEDSNLAVQLPGLIGEAFDYKESTAFINGSGSDAPKGIVTAISGTAGSTVTATTRSSFTSASSADVFALVNAMPSRYEDSAAWVANKKTFNIIRQMSTGSNGSLFWTDLNSSTPPSLLGSPIAASSDMLTTQTTGSIHIVLGDWSQFVIYDRLGTQVEFVSQVFNSSALPLAQRGLVAHKRVGSDCTDVDAFRFLLL